ncbi:hypothetical protein ACFY05_39795 [Microtetraspora fusca]|uniref:Uncharacterized protein n=1 Tax=Microtetraspora fusca TaxID=1997 RepID=A0ABW6VHZ2_MICFU
MIMLWSRGQIGYIGKNAMSMPSRLNGSCNRPRHAIRTLPPKKGPRKIIRNKLIKVVLTASFVALGVSASATAASAADASLSVTGASFGGSLSYSGSYGNYSGTFNSSVCNPTTGPNKYRTAGLTFDGAGLPTSYGITGCGSKPVSGSQTTLSPNGTVTITIKSISGATGSRTISR